MRLRAIAFTDRGQALAEALGIAADRGIPVAEWTRTWFGQAEALLFIGACGIAVRAIAPYVQDKIRDPAVLVMDESGQSVIPILSGHIGGANALAIELARKTGGQAVLTTASDVRGVPAIDTWACEQGMAIENPEGIRPFASAVLAGQGVGVAITERRIEPPFPVTLFLRPRTLILGAGCKKGADPERFEETARAFLSGQGVSLLSLRALATIDLKAGEPAMAYFCEKYRLPLLSFDAAALSAVPGRFSHSEFTLRVTGTDNVCERAAVAAGGTLLAGKTVYPGMTFALAGDRET